MNKQSTERMSLTESLASKLATWLNQGTSDDHIKYLKMKLGIEVIITNLSKGILVYGSALILHLFIETLILHLSYAVVRRFSYGIHADSSTICSIVSLVLFIGTPYLCTFIEMPNWVVGVIGIICTGLLYLYAPADTDKSPVIGKERRRKLRLQAIISCVLLTIIALAVPTSIKGLIMGGIMIQILLIIPPTYSVLGKTRNNYLQYELEA